MHHINAILVADQEVGAKEAAAAAEEQWIVIEMGIAL